MISTEERKQSVHIILHMLKETLIEAETSMAIYNGKLIFFGTEDYMSKGSIDEIDKFAVDIEDLVK